MGSRVSFLPGVEGLSGYEGDGSVLGVGLSGAVRVVRVRYENGLFKPLEPLELEEGKELLAKIIDVEERRRILRKYRGILSPAPKELLDRFILEAEEQ